MIEEERDSSAHSLVVLSPSPCLHEKRRRAYLLEYSDRKEPPQSNSTPSSDQCVDDYSESQLTV